MIFIQPVEQKYDIFVLYTEQIYRDFAQNASEN